MEKNMRQPNFLKDLFSKPISKQKNLNILVLSLIFALLIPSEALSLDEKPTFVVNAIARVPSSLKLLPNLESFKDEVNGLPYYIEKDINTKNPSRGRIVSNIMHKNQNAYTTSSVLGSFFDKITYESFSDSAHASQTLASERIKVAVLLNRIKSIDEALNQEFYNVVDDIPGTIKHRILLSLWEPQWIKKEPTARGGIKYTKVRIEEVTKFHSDLKLQNPLLAQAFLQINECQSLNSIVPYRELREVLLKGEATRSLVRSSRAYNPRSPIYISFMDTDVISLRTGTRGLFSCYEEAIHNSPRILDGLTTGYSVSINQNPFASLAVSLDLANRRALATIFPLAPYYPEPNTLIRVLDGCDTLEVSFPEINLNGHARYTSPQEIPKLMQEIVRSRFQNSNDLASAYFKFIQEGDVETEVPIRFLQNRKKKDGTKNAKMFSSKFSQEAHQFTSITYQDLKQIRNTSQSQLKTRDWGGLAYKHLKEHMRTGSVKVIDVNQPGSIIANRKELFLISMFSSIQSAYSPIAITIREVEKHGYNFLEYLFSLIRQYDQRVPTSLNITFGGAKSTKSTGDLLRAHIMSYERLNNVIDRFYQRPVARLVTQAGLVCGRSEIPILIRYIQVTHTPAVPRIVLNTKVKNAPQRVPKLLENAKEKMPKKEAQRIQNVYPKAQFTLPNVTILLRSLYNRVSYPTVDDFIGLNKGNAYRIVNSSKKVSPNIEKLWSKFNTQSWDIVLNGLSISLQDLVTITNASLVDLESAKENNINFLDAFFYLKK